LDFGHLKSPKKSKKTKGPPRAYPGRKEQKMKKERDMRAVKMLVDAILKEELSYCQSTGSTAYVVEENGKLEIVYNALARPIVASAKWEDRLGNPQWTIYDDDGEAVAAVATEIDGTVTVTLM
jgi:hypothetical protein